MNTKHVKLVADAETAINAVFSDTSVSHATTKDSLETLRDLCNAMIDGLGCVDGVTGDE